MFPSTQRVMSVVLAGGEGKRLRPLSRVRAKPAIPFGGKYRIIDFVLTNLVHSDLLKIHVLTQYQSYSLIQHLSRGWNFSSHLGQFCEVIPAASGEGKGWYLGSADAMYQNLSQIVQGKPKQVVVLGADHVYRMDVRQMLEEHIETKADISVAVIPQPKEDGHRFGCIGVDANMRVTKFLEKPKTPLTFDQDPSKVLASMGNYIFNFEVLREILESDHTDSNSKHDIGGDIIPTWFDKVHIHAYNFMNNDIPGSADIERGYWRDVGTIDAYWQASMDLVSVSPSFNLYNSQWPILTARHDFPPAKFVFADGDTGRLGVATDSLVCEGTIISGGKIDRTVVGPRVRINSYAQVDESVFFEKVSIGRHCKIKKTIVDRGVSIPSHTEIGYDDDEDRKRGISISEGGIRVVPRHFEFSKK